MRQNTREKTQETRQKTQNTKHMTQDTRHKIEGQDTTDKEQDTTDSEGIGGEVGGREIRRESLCKEEKMCGQGGQNSTQQGHTRQTKKVTLHMGLLKR